MAFLLKCVTKFNSANNSLWPQTFNNSLISWIVKLKKPTNQLLRGKYYFRMCSNIIKTQKITNNVTVAQIHYFIVYFK